MLRTEGGRPARRNIDYLARHEPMQAENKDVLGKEKCRTQGSGFCEGWSGRRVGERLRGLVVSSTALNHTHMNTRTHAHVHTYAHMCTHA